MNAQLEIDLLPDLSRVMWGRGQNMGRFVKRASKFPQTSLETFFNFLFQSTLRPPPCQRSLSSHPALPSVWSKTKSLSSSWTSQQSRTIPPTITPDPMSRTSRPGSIPTFAKPSWWTECTGPLIPMSLSLMTPKTKVIHFAPFSISNFSLQSSATLRPLSSSTTTRPTRRVWPTRRISPLRSRKLPSRWTWPSKASSPWSSPSLKSLPSIKWAPRSKVHSMQCQNRLQSCSLRFVFFAL